MATAALAIATADVGDDVRALELAQRAVDAASDDAARSTAFWALAEVHWLGGRDDALTVADAAFELPVGGYPGRVNAVLVGAWARHDRGIEVDARAEEVTASAMPNLRASIAELHGLQATDPAIACAAFEAAATQWARSSRRAALRARYAAGDAAREAGDIDRARAHLTAVAGECAQLGLRSLGRRVQRVLRATGVRPTGGRAPGGPTARLEVLRRVARGHSSLEIARGLALAPSTVESHVRSAMQQLGASTRLQAAAAALASEAQPRTAVPANVVADDDRVLADRVAAARDAGAVVHALDTVPDEPWVLDGTATYVTGAVRTRDDAARAVLAAVRGGRVVVKQPDDARTRAYLLDGLARVGPVETVAPSSDAGATVVLEPAEREILELLAAGRTVNEIAAVVGYSRRTVQRRLDTIRRRLGVASNAEATFVLTRRDLDGSTSA
jgi:DNA-binding NarL/FixJ family response regulator